ncbi:MAG: aldehyde dehydrogenase family protein [Alphaproteobacteria bacterium]|nr:aldehyde dehydrogenase family protein [Alphaproteobacteria bacterium]MBT5798985.1 aldehyde dehydrogenase family protein [Alphaproteobacteria bacterium]
MTDGLLLNYIDGDWVDGTSEIANINPSDLSEVVAHHALADINQANQAIEAAAAALPNWKNSNPQTRFDILDKIGRIIISRQDELGQILAREEGKTLAEAKGEAFRAGQFFQFYAAEALRRTGEVNESTRPNIDVEVLREPIGVTVLITPWNFPIAIPAWKIAPALAHGNTVVLKPSEITPASAYYLTKIMEEAGLPAGVFNLLVAKGEDVGSALVSHPAVAGISFTGSVPTGRKIAQGAIQNMKKIQLEMGGKNPMVIMDDANLDIAIPVTINGAFYQTGQRCTASSRVIVHEKIYDAFVERFIAEMESLSVGPALDAATQIGPVVSETQLKSNLSYVEIARDEGCEVISGQHLADSNTGYFQRPGVFLNATNNMRSSREEIFGPLASIIKVGDFEEAIATANDTDFGLSSAICTSSLYNAREFKRRSEAGMAMVNLPTAGVDYHVPFGGRKNSSYGSREQGRAAIDFYTTTKTTYSFSG